MYNLSLRKGELFMKKYSNLIRIFRRLSYLCCIDFGKRCDEPRRQCRSLSAVIFQNWSLYPKVRLIAFSHKRPKMQRKEVLLFMVRAPFRFMSDLMIWLTAIKQLQFELSVLFQKQKIRKTLKNDDIVTNINFCSSSTLIEWIMYKTTQSFSFTD